MIEPNEREEIINLITDGINLELLSFELDIPMEIIKQLKEESDLRKQGIEKQTDNNIYNNEEKKYDPKQVDKYKKIIERYKKELLEEKDTLKIINKRNLLAFAYLKAGLIDEARKELQDLIIDNPSHTAYRQLIYLEKSQGNIDDAKLWAYDGIDKFPNSIPIREQLISMAKKENDMQEIISQLKSIIEINPTNEKSKIRLSDIEAEI